MAEIVQFRRETKMHQTESHYTNLTSFNVPWCVLCIMLICKVFSADCITLNDLIQASIKNSKTIESARNSVISAEMAHKLDVGLAHPRFNAYSQNEMSGGYTNITGVLSTLDLPKIISRFPRYSAMVIDKAKIDKSIAAIAVKKSVAEQYSELYILSRRLLLYKNAVQHYEGRVHELKAAQARGLETGLDISREEANAEMSRFTITQTDTKIKSLIMSLGSLSGLPLDPSSFTFGDISDIDSAKSPAQLTPEEAAAQRTDRDNLNILPDSTITRTILAQERFLDTAIAAEAVRQNRFAYVPLLQVGAELNTSQNAGYKIFGGLAFDISGFLSRRTENDKLSYEAAAQRRLAEEDIRVLTVTLRQLSNEMQTAWNNYQAAAANVLRMQSANEKAVVLYRKGRVNETDMLDVYGQYLDSNEKMLDACFDFLIKRAALSTMLAWGLAP
jgi:outer membrane protein TolC